MTPEQVASGGAAPNPATAVPASALFLKFSFSQDAMARLMNQQSVLGNLACDPESVADAEAVVFEGILRRALETWPRDTLGHVHESEIIVSLSDIAAPAASDEISR